MGAAAPTPPLLSFLHIANLPSKKSGNKKTLLREDLDLLDDHLLAQLFRPLSHRLPEQSPTPCSRRSAARNRARDGHGARIYPSAQPHETGHRLLLFPRKDGAFRAGELLRGLEVSPARTQKILSVTERLARCEAFQVASGGDWIATGFSSSRETQYRPGRWREAQELPVKASGPGRLQRLW